jgi:hypothetical protein
MTFDEWMQKVDELGIAEGMFDRPDVKYLCPGNAPRRPYRGKDGVWFQLFENGVPPAFALGEAMVEQDCE